MNGVEILNEYTVYTTQTWVTIVGVLAFIGGIVSLVTLAYNKGDFAVWINIISMSICFVTLFTLVAIDGNTNYLKDYSHIEYKVTIDDSVSMNEFLDKYEILDQEGKIYTVKEK
jgi:hypothetical protein